MTLLNTTILGILEGITEFLPISSTGHLMIASRLLEIPTSAFSKTFEVAIQSGAIFAVCLLYFKKVLSHIELLPKIAVASIPTFIAGLTLYPIIKNVFMEHVLIVFYSLIIGGIAILIVEHTHKETPDRELETLTYKEALLLGTFQILALIPGVSRSGATIIGGMSLSYPRTFLVEFSFLLALPTIIGATVYDIYKNHSVFTNNEKYLLCIGITISAVVAYVVMKFLLKYLKTHTFSVFGWYRILVGLLGILFFI